ncbi:unnamed protein product (macronuclear) [Paramecium tetraurelia]|uniref:Transmembrane protein n=1 Tax=Paramecium tetraurelia TaxID=5888 RepID=A0BBJ8_PARTE|nr:uncharacterized protein GSPATT00000350001 [Paramecium tetraurelia]CAK55915.1 unnamed protein product [Paramecium tetraurelia]|eukprot:XP_001423313.1 hypothetical protein (macronuclear) [Paramecium tetraurelia strain d4-2]
MLTVPILPNFINDQKIYSYYFHHISGLRIRNLYNLIIFLSFYIFDSQNKNTKQLTLFYIPLLIYAFETQTAIYIYTYILCLQFRQEKQVMYLRYILVVVGLFIAEQWYSNLLIRYYKLLLLIFLVDTEMNVNIKLFVQVFVGKQVFDLFVCYTPLITHQLFQYKYDVCNFNSTLCLLSVVTLVVTLHIHQENLIFSRLMQIYVRNEQIMQLLSLPIWPALFYYDRSADNLILALINIVQILKQFQQQVEE